MTDDLFLILAITHIASSDLDGNIRSYVWTKISGPASFNIINTTAAATVVKNLTAGTYQFELTVTDNGGLSSKSRVQIIVLFVSNPASGQELIFNDLTWEFYDSGFGLTWDEIYVRNVSGFMAYKISSL